MKPLTIVTHSGTFHTDDVFACATLMLVLKDQPITIVRSRDMNVIQQADIAFDVGDIYDEASNRFDHHQKGGAAVRSNGIPYASFGLVWKKFGIELTHDQSIVEFIDEQLVQGIDGADNGVVNKVADKGIYTYSVIDTISAIRPTWQEEKTADQAFMDAVEVAKNILLRTVAHAKSFAAAEAMLEEAYEAAPQKTIIEIGYEYPGWLEVMSRHPEPLYVIYQREDKQWGVKAVRIEPTQFASRKPLPEQWAGLRNEELQQVSGVADAVFCHNDRFIVVAHSREGAYLLAQKAVNL